MTDSTKCLFCTDVIFPYTVANQSRERSLIITDKNGSAPVPTFSKLCECLQLNNREERDATLNGRRILFEKLDCYYGNGEVEVSSATGCDSFLCLSCFERVDHLSKLHVQLKEIQRKIRDTTKGIEVLLGKQYKNERRSRRENDKEFLEVWHEFRNYIKLQRAGSRADRQNNEAIVWVDKKKGKEKKATAGVIQQESYKRRKFEDDSIVEHIVVKPEIDINSGYYFEDEDDMDTMDPLAVEESLEESPLELEVERDIKITKIQGNHIVSNSKRYPALGNHGSTFTFKEQDGIGKYEEIGDLSNSIDIDWQDVLSTSDSQTTPLLNTPTIHTDSSSKKLACPHCPPNAKIRFKSKVSLRNHIKMKHTSDDEKNIRCEECGAGFMSNAILQRHLMKVHRQARLECPYFQCGKTFMTKHFLTEHVELHQLAGGGPAVLKCNLCDKEFSSRYCLRTHIQTQHEATNPAQCTDCGKTMKNLWCLRSHRSSGCGNREIKCEFCGLVFRTDSLLVNHKQSAHPCSNVVL